MAHNIIEVPKIPRERKELQNIIGTARHNRKRATIKRIIAIVVILVAISLLIFKFATVHHAQAVMLYLGGRM